MLRGREERGGGGIVAQRGSPSRAWVVRALKDVLLVCLFLFTHAKLIVCVNRVRRVRIVLYKS